MDIKVLKVVINNLNNYRFAFVHNSDKSCKISVTPVCYPLIMYNKHSTHKEGQL